MRSVLKSRPNMGTSSTTAADVLDNIHTQNNQLAERGGGTQRYKKSRPYAVLFTQQKSMNCPRFPPLCYNTERQRETTHGTWWPVARGCTFAVKFAQVQDSILRLRSHCSSPLFTIQNRNRAFNDAVHAVVSCRGVRVVARVCKNTLNNDDDERRTTNDE